jgi:hypothetical protein
MQSKTPIRGISLILLVFLDNLTPARLIEANKTIKPTLPAVEIDFNVNKLVAISVAIDVIAKPMGLFHNLYVN